VCIRAVDLVMLTCPATLRVLDRSSTCRYVTRTTSLVVASGNGDSCKKIAVAVKTLKNGDNIAGQEVCARACDTCLSSIVCYKHSSFVERVKL
jgi:hypothetical protein